LVSNRRFKFKIENKYDTLPPDHGFERSQSQMTGGAKKTKTKTKQNKTKQQPKKSLLPIGVRYQTLKTPFLVGF
jgi:hypothetical protein